MFTAITVTRTVLRDRRRAAVGPQGEPVRRDRGGVPGPPDDHPRPRRGARACLTSSASGAGSSRFSLAVTIPGLIFILARVREPEGTGLQFAIDFTGGTVWTIRFEDPERQPGAGQGRPRGAGRSRPTSPRPARASSRSGPRRRRSPPRPRRPTPVPSLTPAPSGSASGSPATSAGRPRRRSAGAVRVARPVRLAGAVGQPVAVGDRPRLRRVPRLAGRQPVVQPGRRDRVRRCAADPGQARRDPGRPRGVARHDRRAAVAVDGRRGGVERPDHAGPGR